MQITVDVTSLVIGLLIGGVIIWIILKSTRPREIDEPPRRDLISDLALIRRGLSLAFDILRTVRRPSKKSSISRRLGADDRTFQYIFDHLIERGLLRKVDTSDREADYVLSSAGRTLCELFEGVYEKMGCDSIDQGNRPRT